MKSGTAHEERLRVLHIGKYFPPHAGGMETYLRDLMVVQHRQGLNVTALVHASRATTFDQDRQVDALNGLNIGSLLTLGCKRRAEPIKHGRSVCHLYLILGIQEIILSRLKNFLKLLFGNLRLEILCLFLGLDL